MKTKKQAATMTQHSAQQRTGAQCVVDCLSEAGCDTLFGYPGGTVLDIFNCIADAPFRFILGRHEQGVVHEADGYARATGKCGVCLVTSGPGATNTVTGLATAYMDGIPLVCITGQVALALIGTDAFQEADTVGISRAVTKHNFLVRDVDELPQIIAEAFYIATHGKPGPVVIDIPKNIQRATTTAKFPKHVTMRFYHPVPEISPADIDTLAAMINRAKEPVLYVGGGVATSGAEDLLIKLAHKADIPVATTLMGLGAFPETDPLALRMAGMHGSVAANFALDACDLIIAIGARFNDRVTGKVSEFATRAKIIHIDIDRSAIAKNVRTDLGVHGDIRTVLTAALPKINRAKHPAWHAQIDAWRAQFPTHYHPMHDNVIMPQAVIEAIDTASKGKALVVTDVGQQQMWAAQYFRHTYPRHFLTSGGMGTMGFGIPAAIGAQLGCPDATVVCVSGDGGAQMNFQELVVAVEHKLPIVFVIINNGCLGMVRQWQELFYHHKYCGVILGSDNRGANEAVAPAHTYLPDFVKLAEAHGAHAMRIIDPAALLPAIREAIAARTTYVVECIVEPEANVMPIIPAGEPLSSMIRN